MKTTEFEKLLKEQVIGKEYDNNICALRNAAIAILQDQGFASYRIEVKKSKSGNDAYVTIVNPYIEARFIRITFKKKKGNYHHAYSYSWYDWTYSDLSVSTYEFDTVEASCRAEVARINQAMDSKKSMEARATELIQSLLDNGMDTYKAQTLISFTNSNWYRLIDNVKKQNATNE